MEITDLGMRVERRGHVLEITLDRGKANAIDNAMSRELGKAFVSLRDDPELRAGLRPYHRCRPLEFALPEMSLGIVPDAGALQRLPRRLPYTIALEMLLMGRRMPAEEAQRYGLINLIVPDADLMTTARAWTDQLADSAPLAVQTVKEVLRAIEGDTIQDAFHTMRTGELPTYRHMLRSDDAKEGVRAFVEKRKPNFKGA